MAALPFPSHPLSTTPLVSHDLNLCSKRLHFPSPPQNPRNPNPYTFSRVFSLRNSLNRSGTEAHPSEIPNKNSQIQLPWRSSSIVEEQQQHSAPSSVKMPTAPWMRGPLLIPSDEVLDFSRTRKKPDDNEYRDYRSLTDKVRGGRGKHAMRKILEGITKLREIHEDNETQNKLDHDISISKSSCFGEIVDKRTEVFNVPLDIVSEGENPNPNLIFRVKLPWARAEKIAFRREKKERTPTEAELRIAEPVLSRLRTEAAKLTKWVKVKKVGLTQGAVDEIRFTWKRNELAMVKFDVPLCRNMERAREIVETKTGGLVVWSKKDSLVVYRGCNYKLPSNVANKSVVTSQIKSDDLTVDSTLATKYIEDPLVPGMAVQGIQFTQSSNATLFEREADRLLDGLGPRFIDWWWPKPLPVDADLLPEVVPDFRPPFRLCPPRVKPKLTDDELTYLRKIALALPTHFALGKNTKLQGLAAAIIKLWEKSLIAKIAVKWGIPNTNNNQMSWELKRLTGGVLLLRNKFFIILYRGKDFLPSRVSGSIAERESHLKNLQAKEEDARLKAVEPFNFHNETLTSTSSIGTVMDFQENQAKYGLLQNENWEIKVQIEAEKERLEKELRKQERSLMILKSKMERSEKVLAELNCQWRPAEQEPDREMLTEEEKQTFRKIGRKMDQVLLLGRRGIYDGVIGSIHQHWKHKEVVKVITRQREFSGILNSARLLEIESGGILVSVEKLRKGHAIIIYRGKNYRRPPKLLPQNLLTKKAALMRSIELQRRGCLRFFVHQREKMTWSLKCQLKKLQERGKKLLVES